MDDRHTTEATRTQSAMPRHTRNMTAWQIVQYLSDHWESQTSSDKDGRTIYKSKTAKMLRDTYEAFFDPSNWKAPMYAIFPKDADGRDASEWLKAAIIWFHGTEPFQTFVGVGSQGYAC